MSLVQSSKLISIESGDAWIILEVAKNVQDGEMVISTSPHRAVLYATPDLATQIAALSAALAAVDFPPLDDADVSRVAAIFEDVFPT